MNEVIPQQSPVENTTDDSRPYTLEDQVGHLLRRAHQRHTTIFQEEIGPSQLTPLQFAALVKLRDVDRISQNQLGRLTAMDAATMQGVIKRLYARNFIVRRPNPTDRRRLHLSLSAEGEEFMKEAPGIGHAVTNSTLAPFTLEERETFLRLLKRLI